MAHPEYDLIIFDCDGVLIDSEVISAQTLIALVEPLGIQIDQTYVRKRFLGRSFPTVAEIIRRDHDVRIPDGFELLYRQNLLESFETQLKPTRGVEAVLAGPSTPYCLATSSSRERVIRSLSITGLSKYFEGSIFTASEVKRGKPAPDLFLHVSKCRDVAPTRCLVIEDSLAGIEAAQAADMAVLRYTGGEHLAGLQLDEQNGNRAVPCFDSWSDFSNMVSRAANERT